MVEAFWSKYLILSESTKPIERVMVLQAALDARMGGGGSEAALINTAAVAVVPRPKDAALQPKRRLEVQPINGSSKKQQVPHWSGIAATLWLLTLPVSITCFAL